MGPLAQDPHLFEAIGRLCILLETLALALLNNKELVANVALTKDEFSLFVGLYFEAVNKLHLVVDF